MNALEPALRLCLFVIFASAAVGKLRSQAAFDRFSAGLAAFGFGEGLFSRGVACLVVAAESGAASGLLIWPPVGYALSALLLLAFITLIAHALWRGRAASCNCFGASSEPLGPAHLLRNVVMLAIALTGQAVAPLSVTLELRPEHLAVGAGGALAGWLLTRWEDLVFLVRPARKRALNVRGDRPAP